MKKQKKDPLYKSFGYAFAGIFAVVTKIRYIEVSAMPFRGFLLVSGKNGI